MDTRLDPLLQQLQIPEEYSYFDKLYDNQVISRLELWKQKADECLTELRQLIVREMSLSARDQAKIIAVTAPFSFEDEDPWISTHSRDLSKEILISLPASTLSLLQSILTDHLKPLFKSNPHPSLNPSTGRKLPDSQLPGGMAMQDYYEGQIWKKHPGAGNLVRWCVGNIKSEDYERLWYLVVPPAMTLLDDYEVGYKLRGIVIVGEMLERVPGDLLKKTGVDGLLFTSLKTSLTNLHNPLTSSLLLRAIPTLITLITLTTSPGSAARFDKLCEVLGDGIIGNVWMYAYNEPESILASLNVLPLLIEALGIGSVRYSKAFIPQLVHPLLPTAPFTKPSREIQLSSLRALRVIVRVCAPRIRGWKGDILEGVAKCWVGVVDAGVDDKDSREMKTALKDVCEALENVCPEVADEDGEYRKFVEIDEEMFGPLFGRTRDELDSREKIEMQN